MAENSKPIRLRQPTDCPICAKISTQKYHPFCSGHCANVDLNRWLSGHYRVPTEEEGVAEKQPDQDGNSE